MRRSGTRLRALRGLHHRRRNNLAMTSTTRALAILWIGLTLTLLPPPRLSAAAGNTNEIFVVPFSHLDLFWAGTREECLSRGNRIISKAIQLAQRQPEFRFLIEDEVFLANFVESHRGSPELAELRRLVKEGRIEIAPKWAAIYQNLPRGEAHVRNQLYGKLYAREVFGVNPQVAHLGDLPGYTEQFPQILTKSDTPFMAMTRMGPPEHPLFRWRAPDGSTALVWNAVNGYGWGVGLGLHRDDFDEDRLKKAAQSIADVQARTRGPLFVGWGTDLFAPSENLVRNVELLNQRLAPMRFRLATPADYFKAAAGVPDVPELSGEIPSSWANIITSLSQLWPPAMSATDALLSAEKFAALNYALGFADYPQPQLEAAWKQVLQSMDHNNFGQGEDLGDKRKLEYARTPEAVAGQILRDSLRNIAERVRRPMPRCTPIVVFNPLSWQRDDVVHAHVSLYGDVSPGDIADYRKAMRLVDEAGTSVPFHVEEYYGTVSRGLQMTFVARRVPSLGYKTWFFVPSDQPDKFDNASTAKLDDADPQKPKRIFGYDELENQLYRVTIDRATGRVTVFDKELGRVVVKDMEIAALEQRGGDTLSNEKPSGRTLINTVRHVELEANDPVRTVLRVDGELADVPVTQTLTLYRGLKRLDIENTVDWTPGRFMKIEQLFPYEHPGAGIRYGIPFGSAAGSDIMTNSGPHFGDEVPHEIWKTWRQLQDWIFAGTQEWGVTISADRQLVTLGDGVIRVGMLRGCYSTLGITHEDKPTLRLVPPAGKYVFRYSVTSGKGDWASAKSYRAGLAFSNPLVPVTAVDELSTKSLPPTRSFCSLDSENLVVTALKKAERDGAVVLRVVEMEGARAETPVEFLNGPCGFQDANLLEAATREANQQTLHFSPYEIKTVRLEPNSASR
jgi:alpha-mannosidase